MIVDGQQISRQTSTKLRCIEHTLRKLIRQEHHDEDGLERRKRVGKRSAWQKRLCTGAKEIRQPRPRQEKSRRRDQLERRLVE